MTNYDHFFWLLSTSPQVIAAIVGIVLMLSVFKLQRLNDKLLQVMTNSYNTRLLILGKQHMACTARQFVDLMEPMSIEGTLNENKKEEVAELLLFAFEANKIINHKVEILSKLKACLLFNSFVVVVCLTLIPFSRNLVEYNTAWLFIVIFFVFLSFLSIIGYVFIVISSYLEREDLIG